MERLTEELEVLKDEFVEEVYNGAGSNYIKAAYNEWLDKMEELEEDERKLVEDAICEELDSVSFDEIRNDVGDKIGTSLDTRTTDELIEAEDEALDEFDKIKEEANNREDDREDYR